MQSTNLLHLPAAGTHSARPKRTDSKPAEPSHDVHVILAEMLPQFVADREAAEAALDAIHNRFGPRRAPRTPDHAGFVAGPLPEELEAERRFESRQRHDGAPAKQHLNACREREAAAHFARESLALREAIIAAAPVIEARIVECRQAVDREQAKVRDAVKAASDLRARRDALQVQRDGLDSRQADVDKAQARLASASDAGDDASAEASAREIARLRREQVETIEPLDLRLQAAQDAAERAERQQANTEGPFADAVKALHEAELDKLKLARDETAVSLRDRDLALWTAGFSDRASTEYRIGFAPEVLQHLGGRQQEVSTSFLGSHATRRRSALDFARPDAT